MLLSFMRDDMGQLKESVDLKEYQTLSQRKVSNVTVQELCKLHPKLLAIRLDDCEISDVALCAIARYSPQINRVFLSGCLGITNVGLRSFSLTCGALQTIDLSRCPQLDDVGLSSIAAGCWGLRELKLSHCGRITDEGLISITVCRQLEVLDVEGCGGIGDYGSRVLKDLGRHCSRLRTINWLGCKRVEDEGLRAIARGCPDIDTFLASGGLTVSSKGLKVFLASTPRLRSLTLRDCERITDADVKASFEARSELVRRIVKETAANIPEGKQRQQFISSYRDTLTELDISGARSVSDRGVLWVAQSSVGASLLSLSLAQCRLTDQSSYHVVENLTRLRSLDLSSCPMLTDTSVHNLAMGVTAISTLKLNSNDKISMAALISHIGEKLPFANLAKNWVGYEPKLDYVEFIKRAELRQLHTEKAVLIQSWVRRKLAYNVTNRLRVLNHLDRCIPRAQALVRGYQQRLRYRRMIGVKHVNRMATKIQCQFRKFVHSVRIERRLKAKRWLEFQDKLSRLIQRVYRGMVGRRKAQGRRDALANLRLKEARLQAKRELKVLVIQRNFRARIGRNIAYELTAQRELFKARIVLEDRSSVVIQRVYRGMRGRRLANEIRLERSLWKRKWLLARRMQKVFRGFMGRRTAALVRLQRNNAIQLAALLIIQRVYRGFRGYLRGKAMREEKRLRQLKTRASKHIQRIVRGHQARMTAQWLMESEQLNRRKARGALLFQRLYRGHKGREAAEVERELIKFEESAKPLYILLQQYNEGLDHIAKQISILTEELIRLKEEITESELELAAVIQNKEKYTDSHRLNKTPQRFVTKYLRVRLRDYIVQNTELFDKKNAGLAQLQARMNELSRQKRKVNRELVPLTTGCITKVKLERGKRLRAQVRRRESSAVLIQKIWRGYLPRKGYRDPARDYWIPCTDEDQSEHPYYYNTWTQETSWLPPYIFRYISRPVGDPYGNGIESDQRLTSEYDLEG